MDAAKEVMKANLKSGMDNAVITSALDTWKKGFQDLINAKVAAANARASVEPNRANWELELKKDAGELETVKILFNKDNEESKLHLRVHKKKALEDFSKEDNGNEAQFD